MRRGRQSGAAVKGLVGELYRRAAISFPDEDVLVAGRIAHPAAYSLLGGLADVVPRPNYSPTGEERAWGRRLARRFGCEGRYDDRAFRVAPTGNPEAVLDASTVKGGGKAATEVVGTVDVTRGEAVIVFGWATADALANGLGHYSDPVDPSGSRNVAQGLRRARAASISARSASGVVTGSRHANRSQTYAAGCSSTSVRSASSGVTVGAGARLGLDRDRGRDQPGEHLVPERRRRRRRARSRSAG